MSHPTTPSAGPVSPIPVVGPFRGLVVTADAAREVVSPAHDALTADRRRAHRAAHPDSYLHVTRAAEDEPDANTVDDATLVQRGRRSLERLLKHDRFAAGAAAFYVYRLVDGGHAQCGVVCEFAPRHFLAHARPHEATRPERAALLSLHLAEVAASSSPIACAVADDGALERELQAVTVGSPILDLTGDDGVQQTVWRVDDQGIAERLTRLLAAETLFIIDGHHRSAAVRDLLERGIEVPVLVAIFPEQSLHLVGFHRLVALPPALTGGELVRRIRRRFRVETRPPLASVAAGQIAMVVEGQWLVVQFDEPPVAGGPLIRLGSLDPVVLEREILEAIIGAAGPFDITYVPDIDPFAMIAARAADEDRIPMFVPPVAIHDMMTVAEGGLILPAKSTYFTPKVRSGIFLRLFDYADLR